MAPANEEVDSDVNKCLATIAFTINFVYILGLPHYFSTVILTILGFIGYLSHTITAKDFALLHFIRSIRPYKIEDKIQACHITSLHDYTELIEPFLLTVKAVLHGNPSSSLCFSLTALFDSDAGGAPHRRYKRNKSPHLLDSEGTKTQIPFCPTINTGEY
ncbi:hypothetical protein CCACVL1_04314 [Corchorus capsularis]|uniref:Uncharacterized protein n=1 Tax=Corchorus capsularis TaxID=210143 RepID=A0A1R3JTJ9_COCAP|nr:hypothetical protein CCACVL1_04314 [Corchorus capsularis]